MSSFDMSSVLQSLPGITDDPEKYSPRGSAETDRLYFILKPEDIMEDEGNRVYAMKVNNMGRPGDSAGVVKFRVRKCSTVFFAAVYITPKSGSSPFPHFGLIVENDFEVTDNGVLTKISNGCLVAHAMFVRDDYSTKLLVALCANRDDAFNQLALVSKNSTYQRAMSPGFISSTPCFQLVEKLRAEIKRPFDKEWDTRLSGKSSTSLGEVTNCATFAGKIFYSLAPNDEGRKNAEEGMKAVMKRFEILDKALPYLAAIKK